MDGFYVFTQPIADLDKLSAEGSTVLVATHGS